MKQLTLHIRNRPDIHAVMGILQRRLETPEPERFDMVMDDDLGKTWVGAIFWNVGTLIQDYPRAFLLCGFVSVAGLLAMIVERLVS